jgi:hypothetical protein
LVQLVHLDQMVPADLFGLMALSVLFVLYHHLVQWALFLHLGQMDLLHQLILLVQ